MKNRVVFSAGIIVCLLAAAVPAIAQIDQYDNGPINGTTDAWTINSGFEVSDSLHCCRGGSNGPAGPGIITGLAFGAWLDPGDVLESVQVSITSSEFGGTSFYNQVVNFTQSGCSGNQYGFNVCTETSSAFGPVNLAEGTYWLNLSNAVVNTGDPVYWDENSGLGGDGPSSASENSVGTIPSESFTLLGPSSSSTSSGGTVPEPSSIMLLGSGILGLAGVLRRRF